jgi:hypothetical protein
MDHAETEFDAEEVDYPPREGNTAFADAVEQVILAELSEMREIMLGLARQVAVKAAEAEKPEDLTRLNTAAVKSARAHRQIAVLQLEILGKRPIAGLRGSPAGQASGEGPKPRVRSQEERFPNGLPFRNDDYNDYDDYTDEERQELESERFFQRLEPVVAAMDEDFTAAGREEILRESPETKFKLIYYIPHPATDRAIAASTAEDICMIFGVIGGMLPPVAGTGPPEVWENYNEACRLENLYKPEPS